MRKYEEILILDPDTNEEGRSPVFERVRNLIEQHGGLFIGLDEWGMKKLAYEIRKKTRGYYVQVDFCGTGDLVNELERFYRIDERVLKYMTVLLDKEANLDQIREELAKAEAENAEKEAAKKAAKEAQEANSPAEPETQSPADAQPETADDETQEAAASKASPAAENTEKEGE